MSFIRQNEVLKIQLKLPDQNVGVFVRGFIEDENEVALAESPVTLTHVVDGKYRYNGADILAPIGPTFLFIYYKFFDDASFTIPSDDYADASDIFEYVDDFISGPVSIVVPRSDEIFIEIDDLGIEVFMDEEVEIEVLIDDTAIVVELEQDDPIEVLLDDNSLNVDINC